MNKHSKKCTLLDISYLQSVLPDNVEDEFFDFLLSLDCSKINLWAVPEGSVVFPRVPLIIIEGPLAVCQLLETTLLNLVNYARYILIKIENQEVNLKFFNELAFLEVSRCILETSKCLSFSIVW